MSIQPQEGLYHRSNSPIGNSFCMLSLRSHHNSGIREIGRTMSVIWKQVEHLKKGIIFDLDIDPKHRKNGNLTALVAYARNLFDITGSQKAEPMSFGNGNFNPPTLGRGGYIVNGSDITYSGETRDNHLLSDHIVFQFIADSEFYTSRAAVEVWKVLHKLEKTSEKSSLYITGLYTGFQRPDHRNWLGFHDGISNMKSYERPHVILISSKDLNSNDRWTFNGTYIAFMRIVLDIEKWEDTSIVDQEILIGREKLTGCPLIGLDKDGKPVKDFSCPVAGTSEIIDEGNEKFREHPVYGVRSHDKILRNSHIGRSRPIDRVPTWDKKSLRIYRQGFEFLVPSHNRVGFLAGLNFVSFQNTPERFFRALTYQDTILQKSGQSMKLPNLDRFMSVFAAGIFFAPPRVQGEPFPGAQIFFNSAELRKMANLL